MSLNAADVSARLAALSADDFAGKIGNRFLMRIHETMSADLELARVDLWGPPDAAQRGGRRRPFTLLFKGPIELRVPQRIYQLEHPELGALEMFLVPLQPDSAGTKFEAVFS